MNKRDCFLVPIFISSLVYKVPSFKTNIYIFKSSVKNRAFIIFSLYFRYFRDLAFHARSDA